MYTAVLISAMAMGGLFNRSSCENGNCYLDATNSVEQTQVAMRGRGLFGGRRQNSREPQRDASFVAPAPEPVMEPLSEDVEVEREARILERLRQIEGVLAPTPTREYVAPNAGNTAQTGVGAPISSGISREDIREIVKDAVDEILDEVTILASGPGDMTGVGLFDGPTPTIALMEAKPEEGWVVPGSLAGLVASFIGLAWKFRA